jgi:hypothetical protein
MCTGPISGPIKSIFTVGMFFRVKKRGNVEGFFSLFGGKKFRMENVGCNIL